jgi:glycosyltransferase involved in cell wall biosynthesis
MKALILTHTYPRFPQDTNGPFVKDLSEALARLGVEVRVLTAHDPQFKYDPEFHRVPVKSYRYIWPEGLHRLGYSRTIKADIKLRWSLMPLAPGLIVSSARAVLAEVKRFGPDIVHAHWLLPGGFVAGSLARSERFKAVVTLHGSGVFMAGRNLVFRSLARSGFGGLAGIASCSPDLADRVSRMGYPAERVRLIPNGVVLSDFSGSIDEDSRRAWLKDRGIKSDVPIVLALGRLVYKKGFHHLINSLGRIKNRVDFRFVLAGGGDLEGELKRQVEEVGIAERTIFTGVVYRSELPAMFGSADVVCLPSIKDERGNVDGLPVVLLEAMAAGRAIVASRISGIPLALTGDDGLLVEPGDEDGLTAAIEKLLTNPGLRDELGRKARRRAETGLTWDHVAKRYLDFYHETLEDG